MPITRNSDQKRLSLEEFYLGMADQPTNYSLEGGLLDASQQMLGLLAGINTLFPQTQLWGLTSLARLVVQNADDWTSPWYIVISVQAPGRFHFRYLLPPAVLPRLRETVDGEASSLPQALRYLLIAMRGCGGWAGNAELVARLAEYGLAR
jgi:hypothetical protein